MPLIPFYRYAPVSTILPGTSGTQYVEGELSFDGPTTIYLSETVYTGPGVYTLFAYGTFPTPSQLTNVTVDITGFTKSTGARLENDAANSRVLLYLQPIVDAGTQYVEGDLTFTAPTSIVLETTLYPVAGEYILFQVTGTITGESLITVTAPAGLTASIVYKVGNQLKVLLS